MQSIKKIRNLDTTSLTFSDVASNKYGGKFLYLNDEDGKIYMQLPKMKLAFKVSKFIPKDKNGKVKEDENPRYSINLSFYKREENPKVNQCFEQFSKVDNCLKAAGVEHHEDWFPGQYDEFTEDERKIAIRTIYRPLIKVDKKNKGKFAPTLPIKLPFYENEFKMEIYDKKNRKVPIKFGDNEEEGEVDIMKFLGKGASITPLVSMTTVNFASGYGTGLTLVQGIVEPINTFMGTCVIDDSDDDGEPEAAEPNISEGIAIVDSDEDDVKEDNVVVDSSDDEDDPLDDSPESKPEPVPAPKKKGRRKKTSK
jgi:hypothetical protein